MVTMVSGLDIRPPSVPVGLPPTPTITSTLYFRKNGNSVTMSERLKPDSVSGETYQ